MEPRNGSCGVKTKPCARFLGSVNWFRPSLSLPRRSMAEMDCKDRPMHHLLPLDLQDTLIELSVKGSALVWWRSMKGPSSTRALVRDSMVVLDLLSIQGSYSVPGLPLLAHQQILDPLANHAIVKSPSEIGLPAANVTVAGSTQLPSMSHRLGVCISLAAEASCLVHQPTDFECSQRAHCTIKFRGTRRSSCGPGGL